MDYFKTPEQMDNMPITVDHPIPALQTVYPGSAEYERITASWTPETRERSMLGMIEVQRQMAYALIDYTPGQKRPGVLRTLLGGVAQAGMYSDNPTFARQSMVFTAQNELAKHRQSQTIAQRQQQIEAEYRQARALVDEYFHGAERRAQARAEEDRRMRLLGESIADAMMRRVQEQRPPSPPAVSY